MPSTCSGRWQILLMALLAVAVPSCAFTPPHPSPLRNNNNIIGVHHTHTINKAVASNGDVDDALLHHHGLKRFIIASALATLPFLGSWSNHNHNPTIVALRPPAAQALQERNEALCNTGFFTNIGAWYCTDIGNIGDEGKSKAMSGEAEASVDSLMSKFNVDGGLFGDDNKSSGGSTDQASSSGKSGGKGTGDKYK